MTKKSSCICNLKKGKSNLFFSCDNGYTTVNILNHALLGFCFDLICNNKLIVRTKINFCPNCGRILK